MSREREGHTLQPTALVHEAFVRLVGQRDQVWKNRAHFFGVAAHLMRLILIDHARAQQATKRGGGELIRITWAEDVGAIGPRDTDLLDVNNALDRLAAIDERQARIVELRFFGGLSIEETAQVMSLSTATIKREFRLARAWMHRALSG